MNGKHAEEILKEMKEVLREIKASKSTAVLEELKKELVEIKEFNKNLRKEYLKKERQWEKEKMELKKVIVGLEEKVSELLERDDQRERNERKNNIIVSGEFEDLTGKNIDKLMEYTLQKVTGENIPVFNTKVIQKNNDGESKFLVKLRSYEQKQKIMKNKHKLTGWEVYINDDLIKKDRVIQAKLREYAKIEKAKGNLVKIGFRKIKINEKWKNFEEILKTNKEKKENEKDESQGHRRSLERKRGEM